MLQMPSFKHSVYGLQGLSCKSINPELLGDVPNSSTVSGQDDEKFIERGWRTLKNFFFPLCMWPWWISCLHL